MAKPALCCMSHSPLLNLPGPSADLLDDIGGAPLGGPGLRGRLRPGTGGDLSPDHYNGFFYRCMPAFCRHRRNRGGRLRFVRRAAERRGRTRERLRRSGSDADVDVAISAAMDVDHGTVQPLQTLFADITTVPVILVFINSVATAGDPPVLRARHRGRRIRCGTGQESAPHRFRRPVPRPAGAHFATAPPGTGPHRARCPDDSRSADGAAERGDGRRPRLRPRREPLQPLNPDWDRAFLDLLDTDRLAEVDAWDNRWIAEQAGNSAHEVRTWVAAFAAMAAGPYQTVQRYHRPAPDLIAGFAVRTAVAA